MNKIQKAVADFERKNGAIDKKVSDALIASIGPNDKPAVIAEKVSRIFKKYDVKKQTQKLLIDSIIASISIGIDEKISGKQRVKAIRLWYLNNAYSAADVPIKTTLNETVDVLAVKKEITRSMAATQSWRKAAQDLSDKKILVADVAKDIQNIIDKARGVYGLTNDSEAYQAYRKEIAVVQRRINRLTDQDTSKLRRAYQDILDITNKSSAAQVDRAVKYASYFKQRYNAERIARTEMARAYGDATFTDALYNDEVIAVKFTLSDRHPETDICDLHCGADLYGMGAGVYPKEQAPAYPFHPHCILPGNRIYFAGNIIAASKCFYSGKVIEITTISGKRITVTSNHPIITSSGWIKAHQITKSHKIISSKISNRPNFTMSPDDNKRQPLIEDIFTTFNESVGMPSTRMVASPEDFHGDGKSLNGEVNIIRANRELGYTFNSLLFEIFYNKFFRGRNICGIQKSMLSYFVPMFKTLFFTSNSIMSFFSNMLIIFRSCMKRIKEGDSFFHRTPFDISFYQQSLDNISINKKAIRDALLRLSPDIAIDYIADIKTFNYSGHVYDLQIGDDTIYISNGVLVKNCLCGMAQLIKGEVPDGSPKDYDKKQVQKYISKLSDKNKRLLLGTNGAESFDKKPGSWEKNLRNWNGQEKKEPTIPKNILYGG